MPGVQEASAKRLLSVKINLAANFASLGYVIAAGIIAVPFYLKLLGVEAYGLVAFYAFLVAGSQLLDLGLPATLSRECARYRGGAISAGDLRRTAISLTVLIIVIGAVTAACLAGFADLTAAHWLKAGDLPQAEVRRALMLMAIAVPFQWASNFPKAVLVGFERQVSLSAFNVLAATARSFGVLIALGALGPSPRTFFEYQAGLAVLEFVFVSVLSGRLIPPRSTDPANFLRRNELVRLLRFSLGLALMSVTWVVMTQSDRFILSGLLDLSSFGVFTLAVTASGGLTMLGVPLAQALLPRLTYLSAESDVPAAIQLYRHSTQLAAVVAIPAALTMTFFAEPILRIWTGDASVAAQAAPMLAAYAMGSGFITLSNFPYYLMYSRGSVSLHVMGQVILAATMFASFLVLAPRYGAVGLGLAWTGLNLAYLLLWTPLLHRALERGLHWRWLIKDIGPIAITASVTAGLISQLISWPGDRFAALVQLAGVAGLIVLGGAVASSSMRMWLREVFEAYAEKSRSRPLL